MSELWNQGAASLLRKLLEERGLTVRDLGKQIGVTERTIRNWIRTDTPVSRPTVQKLWELAKQLGVTPEEFAAASEAYSGQLATLDGFKRLTVFLCHASQDKPKVRDVYSVLRLLPVDIWFDESKLLPGQDWDHEIRRALRGAHVVVVFLSPDAVAKTGFVQKEIRMALDIADEQPEGTIFIIPARLAVCDVPERLKRWHWVDVFAPDGIARLEAALRERARELKLPWPKLSIDRLRR